MTILDAPIEKTMIPAPAADVAPLRAEKVNLVGLSREDMAEIKGLADSCGPKAAAWRARAAENETNPEPDDRGSAFTRRRPDASTRYGPTVR